MNRRQILKNIGWMTGAAVVGSEMFLLQSCKSKSTSDELNMFNSEDLNLLDIIGDTILPATPGSFGAKDIGIGTFISKMVNDCYSKEDQNIFIVGIDTIIQESFKKFGKHFVSLSEMYRTEILTNLDNQRRDYNKTKTKEDREHIMTMLRQLTLLGFCTSERASKELFHYVAVPGKYDGSYDYKKGDKVSNI
jgi:hypothetical protein